MFKYGKKIALLAKSILVSFKHALKDNPDLIRIGERHPVLRNFFKNRLDKSKFSGLTLSVLIVAFFYVLSLFMGITENFIKSNFIIQTDLRVANLLFSFRDNLFVKIFFWITVLGAKQIIISAAAVFTVILFLLKKKNYIFPLWVLIICSEAFTTLGKLAFHRPRPAIAAYTEQSFSFPSGHAVIAVSFYGFIAYFLWRNLKKWKYKSLIFIVFAITTVLIGYSRLYLGVHYFSDVIAGYLLGGLCLIIAMSISEWLLFKKKETPFARASRKMKIISFLLIAAEVIFYAIFAFNFKPSLKTIKINEKIIVADNVLEVFNSGQLPKYTETFTTEQEPLNIIIVADNDKKLIEFFNKVGWVLADEVTIKTTFEIAKSALLGIGYQAAPMTPSFWDNRINDFGFEKPTLPESVRERHHARFWNTHYKTPDGKNIYAGTCSFDSGIKWGVTHKIEPDIDTEREYLFNDLKNVGLIKNFKKENFVKSALGKNFSGDQFFTDGEIYYIELR